MIDALSHLLTVLRAARVDVSAEDVADAIWLALRQGTAPEGTAAPPPELVAPPRVEPPRPPPAEPPRPASEQATLPPHTARPSAPGRAGQGELHLPRALPGGTGAGGRAFRSPTGAALPGALALARALRPLRQRVPSRTRLVFDAPETVRRVAEEGLWLPALRPARDRWLDLALVVDAGASMGVWRSAAAELRKLLEWMGAFRHLRVWTLETDVSPPLLQPGLRRGPGSTGRSPLELVDPNGRSLVLLLTDCVSHAWHDGSAARLLETWARRGPLALLQVLPEHLWPRTALGAASPVWLTATGAATPNARLRAEAVYDWPYLATPAGTPVLVSSLEPRGLAALARLVAGLGGGRAPGFVLEPGLPTSPAHEPGPAPSANTRVTRFWQVASPVARRLAGLLAAAPVLSLPVVRLVRQALLPGAWQVHEAEVLLGGLLHVVPGQDEEALDADEILYDFHEGVRSKLLDAVPTADTLQVLEKVSAYVEEHLAQSTDFRALLADPAAHQGAFLPDNSPFAHIAAEVLARLGGAYARLVRNLPAVPVPGPGAGEDTAVEPGQRPDVLRGHTGGVRAVAFSPDGRTLASGSFDETVILWDWATGKVRATLKGHKGVVKHAKDRTPGVNAVAFAPDGRRLASAGLDGTIKLWDVDAGTATVTLRGHGGRVLGVAFAPNGITLASASDDRTAKLWESPTRTLHGHTKPVECVAFSPDGNVLATGSWDGTAKLWSVATGRERVTLRGHAKEVMGVAFAPDGQTLATASADGTVLLWSVAGRKHQAPLVGHTDKVYGVAFSPDGLTLASASWDGTVRLWDGATGRELTVLRGHTDRVWSVAFSPDGKTLASASQDQMVRLWEVDRALGSRTADVPTDASKPADSAAPKHWGPEVTNSIGLKLALIPPGKFLMGSPLSETERDENEAQHEVEITQPFYLGVYPVTQQQYEKVMGKNPSWFSRNGRGSGKVADMDTSEFPVERVSWDEAVEFCRKLSELSEEKQYGRVYRLPTEAEWEYTCQGGEKNPRPALFGNFLSSTQAPLLERTTKSGSYPPNAFGLYDLHGNVWEWCADWYDENYYEVSPKQNPAGPERGGRRVLRGGSWYDRGRFCRAAFRGRDAPDVRTYNVGFRVALAAPSSVPGRRVQVTYEVAANGGTDKVELPFVVGVLADLGGHRAEALASLEDRRFVSIDRNNFAEVLHEVAPRLALKVTNRLEDPGTELAVDLTFHDLDDFSPVAVLRQVELLQKHLEKRQRRARALSANYTAEDWAAQPVDDASTVTWQAHDYAVNRDLAQYDKEFSAQLREILHHPDFQRLEGTWRGLHYLVQQTATSTNLQVRVLNVSKHELLEDFWKTDEFDQSYLFEKVYEEEFGRLGGQPYALLVGDYEFNRSPQDVGLLRSLARVAAAGQAVFVAAAGPDMFDVSHFAPLGEMTNFHGLSQTFSGPTSADWHWFRDSPEARFVALTLPRVLGRLPYTECGTGAGGFPFNELAEGKDYRQYLWMNAAWALAARVADAFARYGWLSCIRGVGGGGKSEGLPVHSYQAETGETVTVGPAEAPFGLRLEDELPALGFLPLIGSRNRGFASFSLASQSCQKPKAYAEPAATDRALLLAKINYTLCVSRFAHSLMIQARDLLESFMEIKDCEARLNRWIQDYVASDPAAGGEEYKARHPLRTAEISVREGKPGRYELVIWLQLYYQLETLTAGKPSVCLVVQVPWRK